MGKLQEAPIYDPMLEGNDGKARKTWILFFNRMAAGDVGTQWTPIATNLTVVGTPVIIGGYFQNQGFTDFWINITPVTSTTSTAGSTYFELPFDVSIDAPCSVTGGLTSVSNGMVQASTNRCYPPGWTAETIPLTITGRVKTA